MIDQELGDGGPTRKLRRPVIKTALFKAGSVATNASPAALPLSLFSCPFSFHLLSRRGRGRYRYAKPTFIWLFVPHRPARNTSYVTKIQCDTSFAKRNIKWIHWIDPNTKIQAESRGSMQEITPLSLFILRNLNEKERGDIA